MGIHIRGKMNDSRGIALSSTYPAAHKIIKATSDSCLGQIIGMAAGQPSCFPVLLAQNQNTGLGIIQKAPV